ncbi:MAG: Na+/H+ antiporter subunit C [Spirochaetes bacterium]|nr:Na+/H+ antiporter subunit C [Spirochaetota bacterium]
MSEYLIGLIFLVGLWGVLSKHNIIKKIIALSIMNGAIVMFFVHHGARFGTTAPILEGAPSAGAPSAAAAMVDPLPQALMLTAIVVGICIIALGLALVVLLHRRFATLDIRRIEAEAWTSRD